MGSQVTGWGTEMETYSTSTEMGDILSPIADATWLWQPIKWSWWISFQVISSLLGVVGNLLVIILILGGRHLRSSSDVLIGHLALADFLTSVFMFPLPRAEHVPSTPLAEAYCRFIFTSFFMWLSIFMSIMILMVISLERFVAIVYPLHFQRFRRRRYVTKLILCLWALSIAANVHIVVNMSVDGKSRQCRVKHTSRDWQIVTGVIIFLITFAIPASVMIITQVIAARTLKAQSRRFDGALSNISNGSNSLILARNRLLHMLYLVIAIFIVCWGPNNIAYFLYNLHVLDQSYLYGPVDRILVVVAFYNSCANPIVYAIRYPRFRRAIRRLLSCAPVNSGTLFDFNATSATGRQDQTLNHTVMNTVSNNLSRA
nr:allatostatin-A receptor-like [Lytechinus pictus]